MITFKNERFIKKFGEKKERKIKIAGNADSSVETLDKVLAGNTELTLKSLNKLADYFDLDVVVDLVPQAKASV